MRCLQGPRSFSFIETAKKKEWVRGFIVKPELYHALVSRNKVGRGKHLKVAYEDIRLLPKSEVLNEMDSIELSPSDEALDDVPDNSPVRTVPESAPVVELPTSSTLFEDSYPSEASLWASYSINAALMTTSRSPNSLLSTTPVLSDPSRGIGETVLSVPPSFAELQSCERNILRTLMSQIGRDSVSESRLRHLPRWIIDKSINKEKQSYSDAFIPVPLKDLPRCANVISSHHFFQVKHTGTSESLKLKCRLVPHGNRDADNELSPV